MSDVEFQGPRDIGHLLRSLKGMHGNLTRYRAEVESNRRSLEDKVSQVVERESNLAEAQ